MSGDALRQARRRAGLSQVETAMRLGVSQTLLSLMEKGERAVTLEVAKDIVRLLPVSPEDLPFSNQARPSDELLTAELAALGYPGFGYLHGPLRNPAEVLFNALNRANLDARIVEALPWLPMQFPNMNWEWLVTQAKLHNRQNRLGFVLSLAARIARVKAQRPVAKILYRVVEALKDARLAKNDTLCQEAWPPSQRQYAHAKRSRLASYWKLDTRLTERDLAYLAA